jgi:hypothetical protein
MRKPAARHGHGSAMFMDATHGLQKYVFKLATLHAQDNQKEGVHSFLLQHNGCMPANYVAYTEYAYCACVGQAVAWAILRSESAEAYKAFLLDVQKLCEKESGRALKPQLLHCRQQQRGDQWHQVRQLKMLGITTC